MTTNNPAKFAFFYMLSLVALVFMAISVGLVIFQIINLKVPDVLNMDSSTFSYEALKFAISALIISIPIYYTMIRLINKSLASGALDREAGVRRWLTYFILFVSAVVIIVWLIMTINTFLNGEITLKFILKALTVLLIAGTIFGYYLYDIRREIGSGRDRVLEIFRYGSLVIVLGSLIFSFFFVESPTETRNRRQDEMILNNFEQIDGALNQYYSENKKLPEKLEILPQDRKYLYNEETLHDPATKKPFEYKTVEKDTYELCADFLTDNRDKEKNKYTYSTYNADRWPHAAGRQCIKQVVRAVPAADIKGAPVR